MIQLQSVSKRYDDTLAVDMLTMDIHDGEVCVLVGPSGCGKTTTLRMLNRLVEPTTGRILIDGHDTRELRPELLRRTMGYAIQSVGLFPHMTVADNIAVVPTILGWQRPRIARRVEELLGLVGLDFATYAAKYPGQLSGGEAQRVGVARALAADPPILLMDEPFGAVDPLTRERLQQQFLAIQRTLHKTVIFVTHDLDEAIRLADTVAVMRGGKLVQHATPEALLSSPADTFVRDFVGADRALKRLSRIPVTSLMKQGVHGRRGDVRPPADTRQGPRWVWLTDERDRLVGWVDTHPRGGALEAVDIAPAQVDSFAVPDTASVREALSRMLGQGVRAIPVVDASHRLVGEVTLHDIEEATAE